MTSSVDWVTLLNRLVPWDVACRLHFFSMSVDPRPAVTPTTPPGRAIEREALWLGAVLGVATFVVWSWLAAPAAWLLDSGEFVATTWSMGISHPPGHPSYLLTSRLFVAPPFGGIPWRVHLASAAASSVAVAMLPIAAARLGLIRDRLGLAATLVAALTAATSFAFTFQAVRAEVYALNVAATAVALTCIATPTPRRGDLRRVAVGAVALGIGLANHHYLTVFAFPAVLVAVLQNATELRTRARAVAIGVSAGAMTQLAWLALVATSLAGAWPGWPWATDGASLWWLVSAQAFQGTASNVVGMDPIAGVQNVVTSLLDLLTPMGLLAAALGLAFSVVRAPRAAAVLVPLVGFNLITQALFDFDPLNPDVSGYFMVAVWGSALLMVVPITHVLHDRPGRVALATVAIGILACRIWIPPLSSSAIASNHESDAWRDARLVGVGPDGIWVSGHFETGFDLWVGFAVEDRRPDITHVHRSWRTWPGYDAMLVARHPEIARLLDPHADRGGLDLAELRTVADEGRDVRLEPDILMTPDEARASTPAGLSRRVLPTGAAPEAMDVDQTVRRFEILANQLDPMSRASRQSLLWASVQSARAQAMAGDPEGALRLLDPAIAISPDDPDLDAMLRQLTTATPAAPTRP